MCSICKSKDKRILELENENEKLKASYGIAKEKADQLPVLKAELINVTTRLNAAKKHIRDNRELIDLFFG